jgi:ABC-type spermidine/putrescine transport system permease subunit I
VDAVDQDDARRRGFDPDLPSVPRLGLLDTKIGLIIMLMLINLPIIIWMLYTYFKEIPGEILRRAHGRRASGARSSMC